MRKIKYILAIVRFLPVLPGICWDDTKFKMDLDRWKHICHIEASNWIAAALLLWDKKEFRNLLIYRNSQRLLFRYWIRLFYRPMESLYIETPEIGGGLFIQHGFATMVAAKSIGKTAGSISKLLLATEKGRSHL